MAKKLQVIGNRGKSAYQYALEGGYTGSEAEFKNKMAKELEVSYDYEDLNSKILATAIKQEASGTGLIHVEDSAEVPIVDFGLEGKTEQEQYSGTNLFDNVIREADGYYDTSGSWVSDSTYDTYYLYTTKGLGPYIFSEKIGGIRTFWSEDGSFISGGRITYPSTMTCPENTALCKFAITKTNQSAQNQIAQGSTLPAYEPYVGGAAVPNPEHPVEIINAGVLNPSTGRYEIGGRVGNKNLFDKEHVKDLNNWGVAAYNYYPIYVGAGNTFNVSIPEALPTGLGFYFVITNRETAKGTPNNYWLYHSSNASLCVQNVSFLADEDYIWLNVNNVSKAISEGIFDSLQIEIGSTTDYTPHASQPLTLTSPVPLTKWDKLVKRDGVYGWSVNSLSLILTGEDAWKAHATYHFIVNALPETMVRRAGYCNQFNVQTKGTLSTNEIWLGSSNTTIFAMASSFYDETLEDKGLANWKAHLNEHPLKIVTYADEEQSFHPLPDEEQELLKKIELYYGVTNITNDQNLPMTVTYVADPQIYIDNLAASLTNAVVSLGGEV